MRLNNRFLKAIEKVNNVVISTHIHPDADGIGSQIALCLALRKHGINAICVNEEPLMERYKYLDPEDVVISYKEYKKRTKDTNEKIDLFIVVDTNSLSRIGSKSEEIGKKSKNILFIDHHPCPKEVMAIHCIDTSMAATGELVGNLIEAMGLKFTKDIAVALYTSILIDTSSFRYPTVSAGTHRLIAKLMDTGVKPPVAYNQIYGTKKITYVKLLGKILESIESTKDEKIFWLSMSDDLLKKYNVDPEDTHAFINHLLILDNIQVACMFRQIEGQVKISLRSTGEINVGVIAQALGGGGHEHSAATLVEGELKEVIPVTIKKIKLMLD